jgi:hypothetical protein
LLPVLDKIVEEYQKPGQGIAPDEPFWSSLLKLGGSSGSGAYTWFNGWVNIFFPYVTF